ncbi:FAD-binding protein [Sneathiella sp.]|uniref:FAD-binding protein n=1 Tax=Sneathiella sp. TaxID=1964365 RepID=UPI003561CFD5
MDIARISSDDQIQEILDWALAGGHSLSLQGNGSKAGIGRPVTADATLDLSGLTGVELYEHAELVMKAKAGTPISDIKALLDDGGQRLAFDPPDYGPLLGGEAGLGTLGGIFSCNLSGPSRIKAGSARDHLLGVSGFTGRGQTFQTGSRVMKNVTGYDLCKLVAGSYGTLVIATSLTFKVLPRPEKIRTLLLYGTTLEAAVPILRDGLSSMHDVAAATWLPSRIAAKSAIEYVSTPGASVLALKIEGPGPSVEFRCDAIRQMLAAYGKVEELHSHNSAEFWQFVGNVTAFSGVTTPVWKLSVPPANAVQILSRLEAETGEADFYLDWAGGLIWLQMAEDHTDGGAAQIRAALDGAGHATLIRGSVELRGNIEPFHPQPPAIRKLTERIKDAFDPENILNPGRMYPFSTSEGKT